MRKLVAVILGVLWFLLLLAAFSGLIWLLSEYGMEIMAGLVLLVMIGLPIALSAIGAISIAKSFYRKGR